jgi:surfeit locus 1 family protein
MIGPFVFGVAGVAVLLALGFWQLSRLDQKLEIIAGIEARIGAVPIALPDSPDPARDRYLPVLAEGRYTGEVAHVLSSTREGGPGSRVIAVLETEAGRRVLVDRGYLPEALRPSLGEALATGPVTVRGNLDWPSDSDSFTPAPDLGRGLWFSRDVAPIAAHLGTEVVMIVAREDGARVPGLTAQPIAGAAVRNDHLEYAITWFSLAAVWLGMTAYLLWRIRRRID